jgi:hypothetical protein
LIESTGIAFGYFASAVAQTSNASQLALAMRAQIETAKLVHSNVLAICVATHTFFALDAEAAIQKMSPTKQ